VTQTYVAQAREYKPEVGRFTAEDIVKGLTAIPVTLNAYTYCWNDPNDYIDLDGLTPIITKEGGTEADAYLKAYFKFYYNIQNQVEDTVADTQVYVPTGYPTPSGHGWADVVYYNKPANAIDVYELKPVSHMNNLLFKNDDLAQLQGYITGLQAEYPQMRVRPGTAFVPKVDIPSTLNPGWYIRYYSTYDGMVYWGYVKNPKEVWSPELASSPKKEQSYNYQAEINWGGVAVGALAVLGILSCAVFAPGFLPEFLPAVCVVIV
jgi:RHS repeat-associated protein